LGGAATGMGVALIVVIWVVRETPEDGTGQDTEKSKGVRGTLTGMFEDKPGLTERKQPAKAGGNGHNMKTSK